MKAITTTFIVFLLLSSCNNSKSNQRYITESSGNINHISVVTDNLLWEGTVGETIRAIFAAPSKGLPQDEPLFSINQIPTQVFSGFATKNRLILIAETSNENTFNIEKNSYAKPQTVAIVKGKSNKDIIDLLNSNADKIIDAYTKQEVSEKLRRINKSPLNVEFLEKELGFSIDVPSAYRVANGSNNFIWLRKSLSNTKTMDLMFYEVPLDSIHKGDSTIVDIVRMRDRIIKENIPGPEPDAYMSTEKAYVPSLYETIINNKPAFETRGVWEIKGFFMAGPFVNYAIEDKINNRYLIAEGYVYAPSFDKRDLVFELEAIIKSIKLK